jgi:hypothetical protein
MNQKELLKSAPFGTEIKRIGYKTYIKYRDIVLEITGPWNPGSVWKLDYYQVKPEFEQAWNEEKLTNVQRGVCSHEMDQFASAMSFGSTGMIARALYTEHDCLGYRYDSKGETVEFACNYLKNPTK